MRHIQRRPLSKLSLPVKSHTISNGFLNFRPFPLADSMHAPSAFLYAVRWAAAVSGPASASGNGRVGRGSHSNTSFTEKTISAVSNKSAPAPATAVDKHVNSHTGGTPSGQPTGGSGKGSTGCMSHAVNGQGIPAAGRKSVKSKKISRRAGAATAGKGSSRPMTSAKKSTPHEALGKGSFPSRVATKRKKAARLRVCVLNSSYKGTNSSTAAVDNYWCSPQHYTKKDKKKYVFTDISVEKMDAYRTIRELVTSNKYDVFFNLCDGARDEKRAGLDVVEALEEMNAAFTGTDSRSFEPSKIDMKLMVGSSGVHVPNFVLLKNAESLAKKCRHLRFPVIVKHLSGYASVGIQKDNRCDNLDELKVKVNAFIKEFHHALVEEFIRGREGTVLACADSQSPHGVKVFRPLMMHFLQSVDDFAYFERKWTMECNDKAYGFLPHGDPAYGKIIEMARNAYKHIMNGVGYGRVDFRIDERSGEPYFLEINPNCGMWYSEADGGDFADVMVQGDPTWSHEKFITNAISRALREQGARRPWYVISHDKNGHFTTRASKTVPPGKCLFGNAVHPIPVVAKSLYKLGAEDATVGCVICRGDGMHQAVAIRHSCEPNMHFVQGRTLFFAAKRQINAGEELTVDYATLRDENMPHFACACGTKNCRSVIFSMPATPRTIEVKVMKKLLHEKKRLWLKEKENHAAEKMLKKRSSNVHHSGGSSGGGSMAS